MLTCRETAHRTGTALSPAALAAQLQMRQQLRLQRGVLLILQSLRPALTASPCRGWASLWRGETSGQLLTQQQVALHTTSDYFTILHRKETCNGSELPGSMDAWQPASSAIPFSTAGGVRTHHTHACDITQKRQGAWSSLADEAGCEGPARSASGCFAASAAAWLGAAPEAGGPCLAGGPCSLGRLASASCNCTLISSSPIAQPFQFSRRCHTSHT